MEAGGLMRVSHSTLEIIETLREEGINFREALMTYLEEHHPRLYEQIIVEHISRQRIAPFH